MSLSPVAASVAGTGSPPPPRLARLDRGDCLAHGGGQGRGGPALVGREIAIAARQREPVRLAHRGHAEDGIDMRAGEIEIARHGADDGELLEILLPEKRPVGLDLVEELGDHRRDPVEMSGSGGTAQPLAHPLYRYAGRETGGIHRLDARRPEQRDPFCLEHRRILGKLAGIGVEVLVRAELGGIDEDRGDDMVAMFARPADQREMPFVQRTHGRHQAHRSAVPPQRLERLSQHQERACRLHPFASADRLCANNGLYAP
ncbi:hypothetical protein EH32_01770 [Erythrobacter litoralis]|uniref:Uncharacterized protein n=1 Tax=Erythrobacter litoralis TaxID=39960 RepID=A0A074MCB2_9SPHN|nr:hypothetical protein EH32_01770 [Erythrobacter litoralis]